MNARKLAPLVAAAMLIGLVACSSDGDSAADNSTEVAADSTTTEAPSPTEASSTEVDNPDTSTTEADTTETTEPEALDGLPSCQEILQQYADTFTPDDLMPVVALFRQWAPFMPDDVSAATLRIAQAYEDAGGTLGNLNMGDQDLSDDAQLFSDWTNDGCPPSDPRHGSTGTR